jgi:Mg2+ and Co2+ transporter CorA
MRNVARLDELERRLGKAKTAGERFDLIREARPLARAARNLHAALRDVRTAIPTDENVLGARDRAYDVERESSALLEEASAALQLGLAEDTEEQSNASSRIAVESHRLNLLAAVCLPITALGAMLGMNVRTGLEPLPGPWLFFAIVGTAFGVGLALHAWVRRPPLR